MDHELGLRQQIIAAEQAWLQAHISGDVDALAHLMAEEYLQVAPEGGLRSKTEVLASFERGQRQWDFAESDEYDIRIYGLTAVVFGRWRAAGVNHGRRFDYAARYVSVWVWRDDRWQIASDQSTPLTY